MNVGSASSDESARWVGSSYENASIARVHRRESLIRVKGACFGSARSRLATHWALEAHAALQLAMVAVVAFQM